MRYWTGRIAEASLALVVVGLALALAIPWPQRPIPSNREAAQAEQPASEPDAELRKARADPERLAALFGWTRPVEAVVEPPPPPPTPEEPPAPPPKQPQRVSWLTFVGFVTDAGGNPLYYLKDARSGRIIRVTPGDASGAWTLVEVTDDRIVVAYDEEQYVVNRK